MRSTADRRRTVLVVVLVFALVAGCGDDDGGAVSIDAVAETTMEQPSARVRMALEYEGGEKSATEGVIDFRDHRAQFEIEFGPGTYISLVTDDGTFMGLKDPPDDGPRWVRMGPSEDSDDSDEGNASELLLDPSTLVTEIMGSASEVDSVGEDEVRGEPTRTYRVRLDSSDGGAGSLGMLVSGSATGTLDVDASGRLRRLVLEPDHPGIDEDAPPEEIIPVPARAELELWDFGVGVDVETPLDEDVVGIDTPEGTELMSRLFSGGPPSVGDGSDLSDLISPEMSGEFEMLASGTWNQVSWEVWEAPTEDGRVCQTLELDPPPAEDDFGGGLPTDIEHNGHSASCGPRADLFRRGDPVQTLGTWHAEADYWYLAGTTAPEIDALDIELADGEVIHIDVAATNHVFALFSDDELEIEEIRSGAGGRADISCVFDDFGPSPAGFLNCSGTVTGG